MGYSRNRATRVTVSGDHHVIETDARRAEAILLVLSGATLQEVADRFGVTRERVRQYLLDAGLKATERQRYRARPTMAVEKFKESNARRRQRYEARQTRIRNAVRVVRSFNSKNGRPPTRAELYRLIFQREPNRGGETSTLASWLGRNSKLARNGKNASRTVRALYRLAGCDIVRRGR